MTTPPRKYSSAFKAKVAIEALQGTSAGELSRRHRITAKIVYKWKQHLLENVWRAFEIGVGDEHGAEREAELLKKIGELAVERDFLSGKLGRLR
jgi:transposase